MEPRFVDANGLRFAYFEQGQGPLVLLLHGYPDTAHTWDRTLGELAKAGYRAVAPFMRGYHPTAIPADGKYDMATLGSDAAALIEALGEQHAIVVGHDWGSTAAYGVATAAPERVKLLVTVAIPHPRSIKPTPANLWRLRHFLVLRRKSAPAKIRATNFAYIDELWRRWSPNWKDMPASETEAVKAALAHPGSLEAACGYYAALPKVPRAPELFRKNITVPTVTFAGEHDLVPTRAFEKARLCYDGSYEVVLMPGGHFMHREHPEEFHRELLRVLRDHDQRARAAG
jgi:pimeloyl-ACP methyl ester carboxylesterase